MKKSLILVGVVAAFLVSACGKPDAPVSTAPATKATEATTQKPEDRPRPATYDPNLKPAQIVWDSPEKQKAWEARQAELKKKQPASTQK